MLQEAFVPSLTVFACVSHEHSCHVKRWICGLMEPTLWSCLLCTGQVHENELGLHWPLPAVTCKGHSCRVTSYGARREGQTDSGCWSGHLPRLPWQQCCNLRKSETDLLPQSCPSRCLPSRQPYVALGHPYWVHEAGPHLTLGFFFLTSLQHLTNSGICYSSDSYLGLLPISPEAHLFSLLIIKEKK